MNTFLKKGDKAPEFTLPDQTGTDVSSKELLHKGPLVVSFYRGLWWPYCNAELEALQGVLAKIEAYGASLVVISPQLARYSKQVVKKNNLTYPVLCDRSNLVASDFGLTFRLPQDLTELYRRFGVDLERYNGDDSWQLPMPARYIIDAQRIIRDSQVNPDYTQRPDPGELPELLSMLNRVLKNKYQAVSQGGRRFGKRSIFGHMWAFAIAAQRRMTALDAVFQHPVKVLTRIAPQCRPFVCPVFKQ
jgi:peroxiredoxin